MEVASFRILIIEIFKEFNDLNPRFMKLIFHFKIQTYETSNPHVQVGKISKYGFRTYECLENKYNNISSRSQSTF